jgi:hypothetical protein
MDLQASSDWNLQNHFNLWIWKGYSEISPKKNTLRPLHFSLYGSKWHPEKHK